jgi:hypothetical protein
VLAAFVDKDRASVGRRAVPRSPPRFDPTDCLLTQELTVVLSFIDELLKFRVLNLRRVPPQMSCLREVKRREFKPLESLPRDAWKSAPLQTFRGGLYGRRHSRGLYAEVLTMEGENTLRETMLDNLTHEVLG